MNESRNESDELSQIGLCSDCQHARVIEHPRGGKPYYRCALANDDPNFDKFPAVPVLLCRGYRRIST